MSGITDKTTKTYEDLGISDEAGVRDLFDELHRELQFDVQRLQGEELRIKWIGRKQGLLGAVSDNWLKSAPGPLKRLTGQRLNRAREDVEGSIKRLELVMSDATDITLPGVRRAIGSWHPLQLVMQEIEEIFRSMGYSVE